MLSNSEMKKLGEQNLRLLLLLTLVRCQEVANAFKSSVLQMYLLKGILLFI